MLISTTDLFKRFKKKRQRMKEEMALRTTFINVGISMQQSATLYQVYKANRKAGYSIRESFDNLFKEESNDK